MNISDNDPDVVYLKRYKTQLNQHIVLQQYIHSTETPLQADISEGIYCVNRGVSFRTCYKVGVRLLKRYGQF